jgi:adenine deaminase
MNTDKEIMGVVFDPIRREKFGARIQLSNGKISRIIEDPQIIEPLIIPGFVDSHIHIESSMLTPSSFARMAVKHGTVAVVADPHEVANVAGVEGINFMIRDATNTPIKFYFGAPSCVPASPFDECYTPFDNKIIRKLLDRNDILFLAEMMNYPGVINEDVSTLKILSEAKRRGKPIDGHAPGVIGKDIINYINAGISTDHECFSLNEALEKIKLGMKILIREGSAAKNFDALHPLIASHTEATMLCSDDCHPDELVRGHINLKVKRALELGYDVFDIIRVASVNPIKHYNLDVGLLQEGDPADFIVVET